MQLPSLVGPCSWSAARCRTEGLGQGLLERIEIGWQSRTHADAAVERADTRHAHEHVAGDQLGEHAPGKCSVIAAIDGDEVRSRWEGLQAVGAGDRCDALASRRNLLDDTGDMSGVLQRCKRADLCDAVHTEMVADFVEALDQLGLAYGIADPRAGHAVRLGEGPEAQNARIGDIDRRRGSRRGEF
jgi:hypothetical protein